MTKKLTKAQLIELGTSIVAQGSLDSMIPDVTSIIEVTSYDTKDVAMRVAIEALAETMPEDTWVDPIKWVDDTLSLDQAMTSMVTTKTMKQVKTVKTGVGAQILQHHHPPRLHPPRSRPCDWPWPPLLRCVHSYATS